MTGCAWIVGGCLLALVAVGAVAASYLFVDTMPTPSVPTSVLRSRAPDPSLELEKVSVLCAAFDCLHPTFDAWPVPAEAQRRAEFWGDTARFQRFLRRAEWGEAVKVVVVGGSFTAGHELTPGAGGADFPHSWAGVLERQLRRSWPKLSLVNKAQGGCSTQAWFSDDAFWTSLAASPPDLVLVEMAVNDQVFGWNVTFSPLKKLYKGLIARALWQLPETAVMAVEAFRTARENRGDACAHCPKACDDPKVVRPADTFFCPQWWDIATIHQEVLRELAVPYFSYRDLVWPNYTNPPADLNKFWNGLSHPDKVAHTLVGTAIAEMIFRYRSKWLTGHEPKGAKATVEPEDLRAYLMDFGLCYETTAAYRALDGEHRFPPAEGSNLQVWRFIWEGDKPGWIANDAHPAADPIVSFTLKVGRQGSVMVDYLQSYHAMGTVEVWFDNHIDSKSRIDAFSTDPFSITVRSKLKVDPGEHKITFRLLQTEVPAGAALDDPHAVVRGNKFKILSLTAC